MDSSERSGSSITSDIDEIEASTFRNQRLIDWNTQTLSTLLKKIVARREVLKSQTEPYGKASSSKRLDSSVFTTHHSGDFFDDVKEIIELPAFQSSAEERDPNSINLDSKIHQQLEDYVTCISSMYHDNAFHNFEHASHVTMSVSQSWPISRGNPER